MRRAKLKGLGWLALALTLGASLFAWNRANALAVGMIVNASQFRRSPVSQPRDVRETLVIENAGARVHAWVLDPVPLGEPRGTIVVLHGIRDSKLSSLGSARDHARRGYRTVIPDSRAHGESTGRYLSYGVLESQDLVVLVDRLAQRGLLAPPLFVVGTSYGAATAIQYAALDPRVERVVAIAPFASLREVVPAYLHWMLGSAARVIPAAWVNQQVDAAGRIAGFDPDRACPRCVAQQVKAAVLIIASRDDERIPYRQAQEIRDALGPRARLMSLDGVEHLNVGNAAGVSDEIARWLDTADGR